MPIDLETKRKESLDRLTTWRRNNPEAAKQTCRNYHLRHAEEIRERKRRYYQEKRKHQDKSEEGRLKDRLKKSKRAALKRDAEASLTSEEWHQICVVFDFRCAYCKQRKPLEQDHVTAITKGGSHTKGNVVPACKSCNASKGNSRANPAIPSEKTTVRPVSRGNAVLTEGDIREIRRLSQTRTRAEIARMFNLHRSHVTKIILRHIWAWIP